MSRAPSRRQRYPELEEHYELHETLGSGGFAKVKAGVHKLTGEKVAVKIMDKVQLGPDLPRVYREIRALKKLHHQHICQLFQIIETNRMIHLILEFCPGGELFDYIVAKERLKEKEARSFFRQIISALHYVHRSGFIHRDLKPENLLLDDDSNIKLIDFGLVAEPNSTQDLLETCCGSPAYAAPELIRGGPYIGTRADVWSLGVLLYALLNGFLPFDDDHTPRLYQLIQRGEYEIPEWLSLGSISMIAKLLKTDPTERTSVDNLLRDKWVMKGYDKPVDWRTKIELDDLDEDCVREMARYYQVSEIAIKDEILEWNYDEVTAAYFLLLQQKLQGKTPTIILPPRKQVSNTSVGTSNASSNSSIPQIVPSPLVASSSLQNGGTVSTGSFEGISFNIKTSKSSSSEDDDEAYFDPPKSPLATAQTADNLSPPSDVSAESSSNGQFASPDPRHGQRRMSLGQPIHPPKGEIVSMKKPLHPVISTIKDEEFEYPEASYQPSSAPPTPTPFHLPVVAAASMPISRTMEFAIQESQHRKKDSVKKTVSYESRLQYAVGDRDRETRSRTIESGASPMFSRKKRLGSLEMIFKKAKRAFSNRKVSEATGPRKVRGIYDISTTSTKSPDDVMQEIEHVLEELSVHYQKHGFVFHCSVQSFKESTSHKKEKVKIIKFDLEVCLLPRLQMLGVRRKRIKGDVWEYKRVCDQIFRATHL